MAFQMVKVMTRSLDSLLAVVAFRETVCSPTLVGTQVTLLPS